MLLKGKTAVITGCLQGIGRSAMDVFVAQGARVFACVYKEDPDFMEAINEMNASGAEIEVFVFDMSDTDEVKQAIRTIQKKKVEIDALINVAGITRDALFPMMTAGQLEETFQVNTSSHLILSQGISRLMLKQGRGSIVFTSSITALDGNEGQTSYGASKGALISAMKCMAKELGPGGIRVNAVAPGIIKTPMTDVVSEDVIAPRLAESGLRRIGLPEEVANTMLFLASDLSSYVTGQVIRIDGGM